METVTILILITILAPVITGITQAIKPFIIDERFYIIIPILLGLILGPLSLPLMSLFEITIGLNIGQLIWVGGLAGLTSAGLYDIADIKK